MKTKMMLIGFLGCIVATGLPGCSNAPKPTTTENAVVTSSINEQARADSTRIANEYVLFKAQTQTTFEEYDRQIADLRMKLEKQKASMRTDNEKKIAELEVQNTKLKEQMNQFTATAVDKWEDFKLAFDKDMVALGKSIASVPVINMPKNP